MNYTYFTNLYEQYGDLITEMLIDARVRKKPAEKIAKDVFVRLMTAKDVPDNRIALKDYLIGLVKEKLGVVLPEEQYTETEGGEFPALGTDLKEDIMQEILNIEYEARQKQKIVMLEIAGAAALTAAGVYLLLRHKKNKKETRQKEKKELIKEKDNGDSSEME